MHPIPSDVQYNIPAEVYNGSIRQKLHTLSNVRHEDRFLTDAETCQDSNTSVFISVIIPLLDLPNFPPIFHATFFNRFVIIHYLCTHMFLSFIHRYITHKRKPPVPENSKRRKAYFRESPLVHPTDGKTFCSCILIRPNALIHSITEFPLSST